MNDGGPAFPMCLQPRKYGMSLRDYFAAAALGAKTVGGLIGYENNVPEHRAELIHRLTRDCYEIADAMLHERSRGSGRSAEECELAGMHGLAELAGADSESKKST